MAPPDRHKTL